MREWGLPVAGDEEDGKDGNADGEESLQMVWIDLWQGGFVGEVEEKEKEREEEEEEIGFQEL